MVGFKGASFNENFVVATWFTNPMKVLCVLQCSLHLYTSVSRSFSSERFCLGHFSSCTTLTVYATFRRHLCRELHLVGRSCIHIVQWWPPPSFLGDFTWIPIPLWVCDFCLWVGTSPWLSEDLPSWFSSQSSCVSSGLSFLRSCSHLLSYLHLKL